MKNSVVIVNKKQFPVLVTETEKEKELGLMNNRYPSYSMAFPYPYDRYMSFWMKNTSRDLDIIFVKENLIIKIIRGVAFSEERIGNVSCNLVVELPYGTCSSNNIKVGDKLILL